MDEFERDLIDGLRRLADGAPEGPDPTQLRRRLRHRSWSRVGLAVAAGVAMLLVVHPFKVPVVRDTNAPVMVAVTAGGGFRLHRAAGPSAIPVDASDDAVRTAVRQYFTSIGVEAALFEKRRNERATFTLLGGASITNEELSEHLDAMFQQFDEASFRLSGDEVEYSLARLSG